MNEPYPPTTDKIAYHKAVAKRWYENNRDLTIKRAAEWKMTNPERRKANGRRYNNKRRADSKKVLKDKNSRLKCDYGITLETFEQMILDQGGKCAICRRPPRPIKLWTNNYKLCVDHCHASGVVRGLLCLQCNNALGMLDDNPEYFKAAIKYLDKFSLLSRGRSA